MIISAKKIITGDGKTVLEKSALYVNADGKIEKIGNADKLKGRYLGEKVVEYPESTLLPGLVDLHAHLGHWGCRPAPRVQNDFMMGFITQKHAQNAFSRGITALRDVGSPEGVCMTMKAAAERGFFKIPRMEYCGSALCITGGHGSSYGLGEGVEETDGIDALRKAIRTRVKHGSKWIKIMTSHRSDICEFSQEELNAAAEECHRLGVKLAVHSGTQPSIGMCIEAGFDTIEHATFVTREQVQRMIEKGIAWTPTILPYTTIYNVLEEKYAAMEDKPQEYYYSRAAADSYKKHFKEYYDMGVLVGAGTDNITPDGRTDLYVAQELAYMVEYGLTPLQAIQIGTMNGAKVLDMAGEIGQIKEGLFADLLIADGDASVDIEALKSVKAVYLNGEFVFGAGKYLVSD
ncbi:amidohydrolase family protein [Hespellia stercorisuis]|uniref:Imidazolonepropionase n=1 Tax=Hespellia stercorisuis DSM 15480 TaxID=1121950 RepID=A0A1M6M8B1_9FIRM|nr:amidohydrolase family protein [Hespellia stercorisuis]SHJ79620.1 Imidazolonepropionase [Hespellia stercorisuis DSM 15480]